jgi:hypothetical protein
VLDLAGDGLEADVALRSDLLRLDGGHGGVRGGWDDGGGGGRQARSRPRVLARFLTLTAPALRLALGPDPRSQRASPETTTSTHA